MENTPIKRLYYSISEVSKLVDEEQYVLRYWETEFEQLRPQKNRAGNRVYNENDVEVIRAIQQLLRIKRHTIEGAKEHLRTMQFTFTTENSVPMREVESETEAELETKREIGQENTGENYSAVQNSENAALQPHSEESLLQNAFHAAPHNTTPQNTALHTPSTNGNGTHTEKLQDTKSEEPVSITTDVVPPDRRIAESAPYTFSQAAIAQAPQETILSAPMLSIPVPTALPVTEGSLGLDRSELDTKEQSAQNTHSTVTPTFNNTFSDESVNDTSSQKTDSSLALSTVPSTLSVEQQISLSPNAQFTREELLSMRDTLRQLLHLLEKPEQSFPPSDSPLNDNDIIRPETAY